MSRHPALTALAVVAGLALIALAIVYWAEPGGSLPSGIPGHETGSGHHHVKHGIAALRDAIQSLTVLERPELAVSFEELNALVGFAELQARERRYTPPALKPRTRAG